MELMTDTACLLCKQHTTVLKLDNVKSYLDKLFDTFFDKSNIFKDEFQGMVAKASLCLMCTPKVNICCNLRNDYEDKYNGKCLQKLFNSTGCLLCDGNLTPLTKTQDMPSSLLQQIELFMNSTSFPESYSSSALCLTCIHSLNIWHEIRSIIMKLRQSDEVDENNGANECPDSDSTDISNSPKNVQLKSKNAKTKHSAPEESNVEIENVIDLVDSDAEGVKKVDNQGKSATQTSSKRTGKVVSDDEANDIQSKENLSDRSRSESPSLLNNKFGKKFRYQQRTQKLSLNKNVKDKESLISDSSDSEIDGLNKIVEEIVESYENEEAASKITSSNSSKAKQSDEQNISKIADSSDAENHSNTTQKSLNITSNVSLNKPSSLRWISKKKSFVNIMSDSSDSESIKEAKTKKLKLRRQSTTFPKDSVDNEETRIDDSSDEERLQKNNRNLNRSRLSILSKGSPKPESPKHKKADKEDEERSTKIDDSSDEERPQKNTRKLNRSKPSTASIDSSESESSEHKKSNVRDSSDEEHVRKKKPKLNRSRLSLLSKGSPEPESSKRNRFVNEDQDKTTKIDNSSDEERSQKNTQKLNRPKPSTALIDSSESESPGHNISDKKTTKIDDSSDEERPLKSTRKLNLSNLLTSLIDGSESESSELKKSDNKNREKTTKIDDSSDEERSQKNTRKLNQSKLSLFSKRNLKAVSSKQKRSDNEDHRKTSKIDDSDSSNEEHGRNKSKSPEAFNKKKCDSDKQTVTKIVNSSTDDDEITKEKSKRKPKLMLMMKTKEYKKSRNKEQITESEDESDTENTQNSKHSRRSSRLEAQTTIIDDSSDNESNCALSLQKDRKSREPETRKMIDSSDNENTETDNAEKLKGFKSSSKPDNGKSDRSSKSETAKMDDSSDSENASNLSDKDSSKAKTSNQKNKKRSQCSQISSETKKRRDEASRISESSDEFESKSTTRKRSLRKLPSPPKIVLSDSSDQENISTSSSKSRTKTNSKNNKKHDSLWLYLNKRLNNLQSVKKLNKNENINLPDARLDDKFYNQLPYVLLEKNDKAQKTKRVCKEFPKIKLRRKSANKEGERRTSRRTNKSPITITLSDDESTDVMNSSFVEIQTLCCPICDKISKTFCECKAHDLFHEKPEQVVINVVRENLKELQEKYNRTASNTIDNIILKYLNISESRVGELQETISNGHSSGRGSVEVEDEEFKVVKDSTSSKLHIPLSNEKTSSASEDNSDCENVPNIVNEKKRKLSILLNNSRDKSDNSSPNPKRVRFALDHKTSIPNAQSTEDLTKTKLKRSCALI